MAQAFLNEDLSISGEGNSTLDLVEEIKKYITEHDCPQLSMDISHLNIMDASKITILCSTYHWTKYPNGKINWKIGSSEVRDLVKPLNLGNINLISGQ